MIQLKRVLKFHPIKIIAIIASVLIIGSNSFYLLSLTSDTVFADVNASPGLHKKISQSNQSSLQPSFQPNVFHSGSGRLHLLFQHEVHDDDVVLNKYYHAQKFENGSWSQPKQLESPYTAYTQPLLLIDPNDNGFSLYYFIIHDGVYKWIYQEQEDKWQDPVLLFGKSDATEFLQSGENIIIHLHAFFSSETDVFYITWSFEALDSAHDYEQLYIISTVFPNGLIVSQALTGSFESYSTQKGFIFMPTNESIRLFNGLDERAMLLSDSTWSNWQSPSLEEQSLFNHYRIFRDFPPKSYETVTFIDFTSQIPITNVSRIIFTPPFAISILTDFILNLSSQTDPFTICAVITPQNIELWRFNFLKHQWSQISQLNYTIKDSYRYTLDLVSIDGVLHLFWDDMVEFPLFEIFSVSFDPLTNTWSDITQITDATLFTDDYITPHYTSPLFFISSLLGLAVLFLLNRKMS